MSVIDCRKIFESMGGDATLTLVNGGTKIVRTYSEAYRVETDSVNDGPYVVGSAAGLPLLGSPHFEDPYATCRKLSPKRENGNKFTWIVTAEFSTETPDPSENEENPVLKPIIRGKRSNKVDLPLVVDLNGDLVLNTAGNQPTTPVMVQRSYGIYTFQKNYSSFNDTFADAIEDAVNSQSFLGKPAGTIRCNDISASEKYEGQFHYWEVTFEFEYNAQGWQPVMLNDGFSQLVSGSLERCLDGNGEPVTEPVPLDINGAQISAASLPGAAISREWVGYEEYDFNLLGLTNY